MSDRGYTRDEERRLARALREADGPPDGTPDGTPADDTTDHTDGRDRPPACPRCGSPMETVDVPPRAGVAYVRDRIWLTCSGCGRRVVFDRRRLER